MGLIGAEEGGGSLQGRSGRVALPRVKDRAVRRAVLEVGWALARRAERARDVRRRVEDMAGAVAGGVLWVALVKLGELGLFSRALGGICEVEIGVELPELRFGGRHNKLYLRRDSPPPRDSGTAGRLRAQ